MIKSIAIQFILFIFSYLIPKKKNLILFGSGDKHDFRGNPKYLYLHLIQNKSKYEFYWSAGVRSLTEELFKKKYPVFYRYSLKGFWKILRAKYIIIEKSSKDVYYTDQILGRFNFIQTWHGITLKKIGQDAINEKKGNPGKSILANKIIWNLLRKTKQLSMMKYKFLLATSSSNNRILKKAFLNKNVVTLGYPRNDIFFNKKLLYNDLGSILKLYNYSKIILYAPTFRDNSENVKPFSNELYLKLNEYLSDNNILMIIKKHPLERNIEIPEGLNNIKDVSSKVDDIQELYYYTDILISDYSGAVNDFILTNRRVIYYLYDIENYENKCRALYYNLFETLSGPFAENENELFELIKSSEIWSKNDHYRKRYEKQKKIFHKYQDGNSSKRFFEYINNL